jgi:hypothetical protein
MYDLKMLEEWLGFRKNKIRATTTTIIKDNASTTDDNMPMTRSMFFIIFFVFMAIVRWVLHIIIDKTSGSG